MLAEHARPRSGTSPAPVLERKRAWDKHRAWGHGEAWGGVVRECAGIEHAYATLALTVTAIAKRL